MKGNPLDTKPRNYRIGNIWYVHKCIPGIRACIRIHTYICVYNRPMVLVEIINRSHLYGIVKAILWYSSYRLCFGIVWSIENATLTVLNHKRIITLTLLDVTIRSDPIRSGPVCFYVEVYLRTQPANLFEIYFRVRVYHTYILPNRRTNIVGSEPHPPSPPLPYIVCVFFNLDFVSYDYYFHDDIWYNVNAMH